MYYEFLDDDGQWKLGYMDADRALMCQLILGGDRFHLVDESAITFKEGG